jgi:hypothetical protein
VSDAPGPRPYVEPTVEEHVIAAAGSAIDVAAGIARVCLFASCVGAGAVAGFVALASTYAGVPAARSLWVLSAIAAAMVAGALALTLLFRGPRLWLVFGGFVLSVAAIVCLMLARR